MSDENTDILVCITGLDVVQSRIRTKQSAANQCMFYSSFVVASSAKNSGESGPQEEFYHSTHRKPIEAA
jgi:hypothetical protein